MIVSLICHRHGYQQGSYCPKCAVDPIFEAGFNTPKDKLYEFTDIHITGKPVEIRSKKQWQEHLQANHCHDDIPQGKNHTTRPEDITGLKFNKHNFRQEMLAPMKQAFREKDKWLPKEKFYRG